MSTVWFMVDDTDSRLNYTGAWSLVTFSGEEVDSVFGPIYNGTVHEPLDQSNVTLSFRFNGMSVNA